MKQHPYEPTTLDFAYDIIAMHEEIKMLRHDRDHYKKMYDLERESANNLHEGNMKNIGFMLGEIIDPESPINKMHDALAREQSGDQE